MTVAELKAKIEELQARKAELLAGEQTLDAATELTKIRAELPGLETQLAEAEAAFAPDPVAETDGDGDGDGDKGGEGDKDAPAAPVAPDAPKTDDTPVADPAPEGKDKDDETPAPAGDTSITPAPALAAGGGAPDEGRLLKPMVLTASGAAASAGMQPGSEMGRDEVAAVLTAAGKAAGVITGKTRVLEISRWGEDRDDVLRDQSAIENSRIIAKAIAAHEAGKGTRPVALQAAGCFCGPDELIRETGVVGRRGRPFAAMFASIPSQGGYRAMPDLAFNVDTQLRAGVSQWTCDDQTAVDPNDPDTWKPCAEINCFTEETYVPYAVEACVTVERFHRWAHPEQVDAWINLLGIEYDALAETLLIDKIEADAGTPLTVGTALMQEHGLFAKVLYALGSLSYALGYQFREGEGVLAGYTLNVPVGFTSALWADEALRGFPSNYTTVESMLAKIRETGVTITERMDESSSRKADAANTVTALNGGGAIDGNTTPLLPPTFRMYLIPTSGYVHTEGVMVGADWHVDADLLQQNKMRYFLENIESLDNLSVRKPHIIDVPGVIAGSYTDLVAPPIA